MRTILEKEGILSLEDWQIDKLAYSFCRNCKKEERKIRLYDGKWIHVEMGGGMYYLPLSYYSCESLNPKQFVVRILLLIPLPKRKPCQLKLVESQ